MDLSGQHITDAMVLLQVPQLEVDHTSSCLLYKFDIWDISCSISLHLWIYLSNRNVVELILTFYPFLDVLVDGEPLRRDGNTLTIDENRTAREIEEAVVDYYAEI